MFHRMMNYGEAEARPGLVITKELIKKHLPKHRRHDDLVIIDQSAWDEFKRAMPMAVVREENSPFSIDEDELASLVCQTIASELAPCRRLALERGVRNDNHRTRPDICMLLGASGLVTHKDNRITYQFDVTKCMFSFGNVREKLRMAELDCSGEIVVDLFAGIGHFALPLLVHGQAKHLYACERDPDALAALEHNLTLNRIEPQRYTVIEGDNRSSRPANVAQRVIMGILPSCFDWMKTALECVDKTTGAMLHCHDLVEARPPPAAAAATTAAPVTQAAASLPKQIANQVTKQSSAESQQSDNCGVVNSSDNKVRSSLDSQSLVYQSLSSSSNSSHSTIEKLSAPPSEDSRLLHSGESYSDSKDTCSPVLLERPSSNSTSSTTFADVGATTTTTTTSNAASGSHQHHHNHDQFSLNSSSNQNTSCDDCGNSILEPPLLSDSETGVYEARGFALIARIKDELEAHNLTARLLHIQPVKSYAPHVNHVVFDIKLEPRGQALNGGGGQQVFDFNRQQSR